MNIITDGLEWRVLHVCRGSVSGWTYTRMAKFRPRRQGQQLANRWFLLFLLTLFSTRLSNLANVVWFLPMQYLIFKYLSWKIQLGDTLNTGFKYLTCLSNWIRFFVHFLLKLLTSDIKPFCLSQNFMAFAPNTCVYKCVCVLMNSHKCRWLSKVLDSSLFSSGLWMHAAIFHR